MTFFLHLYWIYLFTDRQRRIGEDTCQGQRHSPDAGMGRGPGHQRCPGPAPPGSWVRTSARPSAVGLGRVKPHRIGGRRSGADRIAGCCSMPSAGEFSLSLRKVKPAPQSEQLAIGSRAHRRVRRWVPSRRTLRHPKTTGVSQTAKGHGALRGRHRGCRGRGAQVQHPRLRVFSKTLCVGRERGAEAPGPWQQAPGRCRQRGEQSPARTARHLQGGWGR